MHGNKQNDYIVPDGEQGLYHIRETHRMIIGKEHTDVPRVVKMSIKDYNTYKKLKPTVVGYREAVILHDPTIPAGKPKPLDPPKPPADNGQEDAPVMEEKTTEEKPKPKRPPRRKK